MDQERNAAAATVIEGDRTFTCWDGIVDSMSEAFRLEPEEREKLRAKNIAKLIAAIPYLAGCEDPGRTAVAHLGTYLLSLKLKTVANCRRSDNADLFRRLEMIGNFIGGNREVIRKGMSLIALNMISDYHRDVEADRAFGKYNPVGDGAVDYDLERDRLVSIIRSVDCRAMDDIMTYGEAVEAFWVIE